MSNTHQIFSVAAPSDVGIPEEAVLDFLDRLECSRVPMHALLLMRHGKLIAEGYYAPYGKDELHRMFSICKSLNALAVGCLVAEGRLSYDDHIIDFFPDKVPEDVHPWVAAMTVRDLLMMRTCHAGTTYKNTQGMEWVESFFAASPSHKPGTVFHYDTSAAHVLCQLVQRVSKEPMLSYLRGKVLDRIGWSKEAYILPNAFGDPQGGSGLMCTPRDLMLLGQLLMQNGEWEGEQLLPRDFVQTATSNLTPTVATSPVPSEMQGYGYQIWRNEHNGFVLYGMGCQLVICLPDYDLICVTCADTQGMGGGNQFIYNAFYDTILPAIDHTAIRSYRSGQEMQQLLKKRLENLQIQPISPASGLRTEDTMLSRINGQVFRFAENPAGFTDCCLTFDPALTSGYLTYRYQGHDCKLPFGIGSCMPGIFPVYTFRCATCGAWISPDTFYLKSHLLDTSLGSVRMEFYFGEEDVTVFLKKVEETILQEYDGHLYGTPVR